MTARTNTLPPSTLNVEVEFEGKDAETIVAARQRLGEDKTYAEVIEKCAIIGALQLAKLGPWPHIIALIATCAMAPWILVWAATG